MKHLIKQKVSHVEFIRNKMVSRGWKAADLSRASGVSTGILSRYFNDDGISADNLFAVMLALNALEGSDHTCEVQCDEKILKLCRKVKNVVESETHWGTSLEANIHSFAAGLEQDKEIIEVKKSIADLSSTSHKRTIGKKKAM